MRITFNIPEFTRNERNSHCDVLHIAPTWAETRGKGFEFTCKGCTEVTALVKEVEGLKQMVEDIMEKVAGL